MKEGFEWKDTLKVRARDFEVKNQILDRLLGRFTLRL
jgi:hypothetical protein